MLSALAVKTPPTQAEAIRQATARSVKHRNLYTEQVVGDLSGVLADAEDEVRKVILHYKTLGSLPDNKLAVVQGLKKLEADLQQITSTLRKKQALRISGGCRRRPSAATACWSLIFLSGTGIPCLDLRHLAAIHWSISFQP